jgi:reactive intermediate/imine deaminase
LNKTAIHTDAAPAAIGTYSQAIRTGELIFISGQIPLDPQTGEIAGADNVEQQIRQVFDNLKAVATGAGTTLDGAVKITVYLTDLTHFTSVNEIMTEYFKPPYPARAALGVAALPRGATIEADAILLA